MDSVRSSDQLDRASSRPSNAQASATPRSAGVDDAILSPAGRTLRVLALASGGGHWVQLLRMRPAWAGCDIAYATTHSDFSKDILRASDEATRAPRFYTFPDANRWQKARLVRQLLVVAWIILKEQPDVIISTGASAGYFALRIGKLLRRRTIWVDSIANAEELSLAGKNVRRFADLWLTQWPHLAVAENDDESAPQYFGAVL